MTISEDVFVEAWPIGVVIASVSKSVAPWVLGVRAGAMEDPDDSFPGEKTPPPPPLEKGLPGPPPGRTVPECAGLDLRMVPGSRNGAGPPPPDALEQVESVELRFKLRKLDDIWPCGVNGVSKLITCNECLFSVPRRRETV